MKAKNEALIISRIDECRLLLLAIYEVFQMEEKERRENVHPGLGGESNLGPPE